MPVPALLQWRASICRPRRTSPALTRVVERGVSCLQAAGAVTADVLVYRLPSTEEAARAPALRLVVSMGRADLQARIRADACSSAEHVQLDGLLRPLTSPVQIGAHRHPHPAARVRLGTLLSHHPLPDCGSRVGPARRLHYHRALGAPHGRAL